MNASLHFPPYSRVFIVTSGYFQSGWAFLVPYLAIYLVYARLGWPVNPSGRLAGPPSLFAVFLLLHVLHFLGFILIYSSRAHRWKKTISGALPWVLLGMLLWIPGVYFELPSDPWAHFSRLNFWRDIDTVLSNPEWKKSGSFLAYSILGRIEDVTTQLWAFHVFYTACSLLFYWQYHRFARAAGLSASAAYVAVLINFFAFGNSVFGFARYYGMSTSILAQTVVFALMRIGVLAARASCQPQAKHSESAAKFRPGLLGLVPVVIAASGVIALNHVQGLLIVAFGGAAIAIWRLQFASRWTIAISVFGFILLNFAVVLWWPRSPHLEALYRVSDWLNAWCGFDVLSPKSPAFERAWQILGAFGVLNLIFGCYLVVRRHVVGWLTLAPIVLVLCPGFALPFADATARWAPPGYEYIAAFHRVLFAIPAGLAIVVSFSLLPKENLLRSVSPWIRPIFSRSLFFLLIALLSCMLVPPSNPWLNRFWHCIASIPADLTLRHVILDFEMTKPVFPSKGNRKEAPTTQLSRSGPDLLCSPGVGFIYASLGQRPVPFQNKWMNYPTQSSTAERINILIVSFKDHVRNDQPAIVVTANALALYSPLSFAGYMSGHWYPSQVALEHAAAAQVEQEIRPFTERISGEDTIHKFSLPVRSK
jgi:hypothetical protein